MNCPACSTPNPEGMNFCGICGNALRTEMSVRERRRVSIVFIDLARFSDLTHNFQPEQLRDLADEILTVLAGIIEDYDGYIDAFKGDGVIGLFGAPHSHPDDPQRAVMAALTGLRAIETIGESKGYKLKGRAGVNTGLVIAGSVGSGRVRDYTVMGSAVNLTARLEEAATPGEVWVGPETYEATRHSLLYEATPDLELQGFPNIKQAYRLISTQAQRDLDPYAELDFVGRKAELGSLHQALDSVVQRGQPKELWLLGEAGSGKTRLLREFSHDLTASGTYLSLRVEEQLANPTHAWQQLASQILELPRHDDQLSVKARLQSILPDEPRWHRLIMTTIGFYERKSWTRLERRTVDRKYLAWRDLIVKLSERSTQLKAVVLIIEHSPKTSQLEPLLEQLMQSEAPLLIIRTRRSQHLPEDSERIVLAPLNLSESQALLKQVASPLLKVATESLVFQVGGIPAYILELGQALSITRQGSFSGSLTSLLQARLDMLHPRARRLLAHAALAGDRCWDGLLFELGGHKDLLTELTEQNLLIQESSSSTDGQTEYRFQSELLRRAAERMVPQSDRPPIHLRIGSWLEQHAPLEMSDLIGAHFREGGSPEAAYPHLLFAAGEAIALEQFEKGFDLFEQLLDLELSPRLLAQGALAYAQAALSNAQAQLTLEQLRTADRWIEACDPEVHAEMRVVHAQLLEDTQSLSQPTQEPKGGPTVRLISNLDKAGG